MSKQDKQFEAVLEAGGITIAEIAVRLAPQTLADMSEHDSFLDAMTRAINLAETLYVQLVKRGHIAPDPAPVAGPDWSQAPEWAQWAAQDEDGAWWWYEHQPEPVGDAHWGRPGNQAAIKHPNWRESLQRRPGGG